MTVTAAEVAVVLRSAADVVYRDGWAQGDAVDAAYNGRGPVCASIACGRAAVEQGHKGFVVATAAYYALVRTIGHDDIPDWNDSWDRTVEDVILALKRAAETVETQGLPS